MTQKHADAEKGSLTSILFINPGAELGGAERVLIDFVTSARAIDPALSIQLLTFADGPLLAAVERVGAATNVLALPLGLLSLGDSGLVLRQHLRRTLKLCWSILRTLPALGSFLFALRAEVRRIAPAIVHSNGLKAHFFAGLVTPLRVPLVWHIHDFLLPRPFASRALRALSGRVSCFIAVSDAVAQELRLKFASARIVTIRNAVDVEEFSPGAADGPMLDRLSGMVPAAPETLRVGLVATYSKWKGQKMFLNACAELRALVPSRVLRFYLIGGPIYATENSQFTVEELRTAIADLGLQETVGLVPFQRELVPIYRSLDIVVHSSTKSEPFGRAVVEAMACGRPVVAAAGGGVDELVQDGITGLTHHAGDLAGLTTALTILLDSPELRTRFGARGRTRVVEHFSSARLGPALLDLYSKLLDRAATAP